MYPTKTPAFVEVTPKNLPISRSNSSLMPLPIKPAQEVKAKLIKTAPRNKLRLIALGGQDGIGDKNMYIYEYNDDILVFDSGMGFPSAEMLGVDFTIPDITYLEEKKNMIRGIFITHGHEDHIGSMPYTWPKLGAPIYTAPLTAGFLQAKFEESGIKGAKFNIITPGDKIKLGVFNIEAIHLTHSVPDVLGFAVGTPSGLFLHLVDWKIDYTPVFGKPTDVVRIAELAGDGVRALLTDSTNALIPGYTISEQIISQTFDNIFKDTKGRIIISSFSSQITRVQQVIDAAVKNRRKLVIAGRSMERNVNIAMQLGYLRVPQGLLQDIRHINHLPNNEVAIMCTGSQGQEFSALVRMAAGEHRQIQIKKGDTIVISASPIPGNEAAIDDTVNNLYRLGASVILNKQLDVHVSGHANQEDLKTMIALAKPEYFIPIHGDYHHLVEHGKLAESMGIDPNKIIIFENGQVVEFDQKVGSVTKEKVQSGNILVDGSGVGDVGNIVLRDRQAMAKDGIFVVIITVDHRTGKIMTSPDIISRGFVYMREAEDLIYKSRQEVKHIFASAYERTPANYELIKKTIRDQMSEFLFNATQRHPMVIPVVIEI
ncbi:MAG: ribonuclease J [bacterium]|nr:ribonuclease J [bacterium]